MNAFNTIPSVEADYIAMARADGAAKKAASYICTGVEPSSSCLHTTEEISKTNAALDLRLANGELAMTLESCAWVVYSPSTGCLCALQVAARRWAIFAPSPDRATALKVVRGACVPRFNQSRIQSPMGDISTAPISEAYAPVSAIFRMEN